MNNVVYAFVRLIDEPTRCYYVKDCSESIEEIINLKIDDKLNIQGLGRLAIKDVGHAVYDDEYNKKTIYHVYDIVCDWLSDAWEVRR